jgi:hypothetical protein
MTTGEKARQILKAMPEWQRAYAQYLIDAGTVIPNDAKEYHESKTRKTDRTEIQKSR